MHFRYSSTACPTTINLMPRTYLITKIHSLKTWKSCNDLFLLAPIIKGFSVSHSMLYCKSYDSVIESNKQNIWKLITVSARFFNYQFSLQPYNINIVALSGILHGTVWNKKEMFISITRMLINQSAHTIT